MLLHWVRATENIFSQKIKNSELSKNNHFVVHIHLPVQNQATAPFQCEIHSNVSTKLGGIIQYVFRSEHQKH